jgi:hypothetical protein
MAQFHPLRALHREPESWVEGRVTGAVCVVHGIKLVASESSIAGLRDQQPRERVYAFYSLMWEGQDGKNSYEASCPLGQDECRRGDLELWHSTPNTYMW